MSQNSDARGCWDCGYRQNKQLSLFGMCTYFELLGMELKEIPPEVVDKGCKNWASKKGAEVIKTVVNVFDGEIVNGKH